MKETLVGAMLELARKYGQKPLFFTLSGDDTWKPHSWADFEQNVKAFGAALVASGVTRDEAVSMFTYNVPEYFYADYGSQYVGIKNTPIYMSNNAEQARYILQHADVAVVLVDTEERLSRVLAVADKLPKLRFVLTTFQTGTKGTGKVEVLPYAEFLKRGDDAAAQKALKMYTEVKPDDIYTIVYTSGTTAEPKGVMLSGRGTLYVLVKSSELRRSGSDWRVISYLPLAHVAQRIGDYSVMYNGNMIYFSPSLEAFPQMIQKVKPHIFVAVPRILEKIYDGIMSAVEGMPDRRKKLFRKAEAVARKYHVYHSAGRPLPMGLRLQHAIFDKLVYGKIREKLGGSVQLIAAGGALVPEHIAQFFYGLKMPVLIVYGLTETNAPITYMTEGTARYDTVAKAMPGTEVKIAEDGEILFRGPNLFLGYYKNEQATREAIDADGWFHTGDLGEMDAEGYVKIRGRKKEIIVTSGGKNIAPAPIENELKKCPVISNVMVVGDEKNYLTAIFTLGEMDTKPWAEKEGIKYGSLAELATHPKVLEVIRNHVEETNKILPPWETIKRWKLIGRDFTQEQDELTPTLKVKRRVVAEHFKKEIEELYKGG